MKNIQEMSNEQLLEELRQQNEWSKDDTFEFAVCGRGDNGFARDNYTAELYDEAARRGLRDPLPPSETNDPDFEDIKKYMEAQGFEWCKVAFRKWGEIDGLLGKRQVDYCSFEDAATEWHKQYVQQAQQTNRYEMWGTV